MREIKFRAWGKLKSKMFGHFAINSSGNRIADEEYRGHSCDWENLTSDVVLMQYTGLKDKNGVEIYEGDVVRAMKWFGLSKHPYREQRPIKGNISWDESSFGFAVDKDGKPEWCVFDLLEPEVIGNIYENPELLEEKCQSKPQ